MKLVYLTRCDLRRRPVHAERRGGEVRAMDVSRNMDQMAGGFERDFSGSR